MGNNDKENKSGTKEHTLATEFMWRLCTCAQLCLTLCNPVNHSTSGLPVHHQPPELVMDREAWRAAIHGVAKSRTWLSNWTELNCMPTRLVARLCLTLCDPVDCSLPGSSVHGISEARILEWIAIPFSRGSSQPASTVSPALAGRFFTIASTRKPQSNCNQCYINETIYYQSHYIQIY